jgi:transcriptional regulator with XRE-family HTH domain
MDEKRLSLKDVERRSQGRIGHSYVHLIAGGQTKNLTVEKIRGLATGLDVTEEEVFKVLCNISISEKAAFQMSALANLCQRYEALPQKEKREMKPLLEALDREIDWRNMLTMRAMIVKDTGKKYMKASLMSI